MATAGNGGVSNKATQQDTGIGVRLQPAVPINGVVADVGNWRCVGVNNDSHSHNHIEEVINSNNEHPQFSAITGRLDHPGNRQ